MFPLGHYFLPRIVLPALLRPYVVLEISSGLMFAAYKTAFGRHLVLEQHGLLADLLLNFSLEGGLYALRAGLEQALQVQVVLRVQAQFEQRVFIYSIACRFLH